jgi:hypothetical protein
MKNVKWLFLVIVSVNFLISTVACFVTLFYLEAFSGNKLQLVAWISYLIPNAHLHPSYKMSNTQLCMNTSGCFSSSCILVMIVGSVSHEQIFIISG